MWKNTSGDPVPRCGAKRPMPQRSPQHYRNRARELRAEAAGRTEAITRDILIHVAQQCEQMAAEIEARTSKGETQPGRAALD